MLTKALPVCLFIILSLCCWAPASASSEWQDTEQTTLLWKIISQGDMKALKEFMKLVPETIVLRSGDGRGALFWAYEFSRMDMVSTLLAAGADEEAQDKDGMTPAQLKGTGTIPDPEPINFGNLGMHPPAEQQQPPRYPQSTKKQIVDDDDDDDDEEDEDEDEDDEDEKDEKDE
eukprot:TRINITY_DN543_c0_g1_i1.p1 TRINITY_DN543_c0_g1~~TRINITY_DN543_c0_g1_i1.p1  ORF type:complete len:174 (-),score=45.98 TRINITY_DN543_c0_g1_i1:346-867(-)